MLFIIFFTIFEIFKITIDENKAIIESEIELEEKEIEKGVYVLKGNLSYDSKIIGNILRLSRIYFPCNKKPCKYKFEIETEMKNIDKNDLLNFIERKKFLLNIILNEVNKKEEIKKVEKFTYKLDVKNFTELDLNLLKIEDLRINLKEKPSIKFNFILKNPFYFKIKLKTINLIIKIENYELEKNFSIEEEIGNGDKIYPLEIPIKNELLINILTKKFLEEDISSKVSANYNGKLTILFEKYFFDIPFSK